MNNTCKTNCIIKYTIKREKGKKIWICNVINENIDKRDRHKIYYYYYIYKREC